MINFVYFCKEEEDKPRVILTSENIVNASNSVLKKVLGIDKNNRISISVKEFIKKIPDLLGEMNIDSEIDYQQEKNVLYVNCFSELKAPVELIFKGKNTNERSKFVQPFKNSKGLFGSANQEAAAENYEVLFDRKLSKEKKVTEEGKIVYIMTEDPIAIKNINFIQDNQIKFSPKLLKKIINPIISEGNFLKNIIGISLGSDSNFIGSSAIHGRGTKYDIKLLESFFQNHGFPDSDIEKTILINEITKTASLVYRINTGTKFGFNTVNVIGARASKKLKEKIKNAILKVIKENNLVIPDQGTVDNIISALSKNFKISSYNLIFGEHGLNLDCYIDLKDRTGNFIERVLVETNHFSQEAISKLLRITGCRVGEVFDQDKLRNLMQLVSYITDSPPTQEVTHQKSGVFVKITCREPKYGTYWKETELGALPDSGKDSSLSITPEYAEYIWKKFIKLGMNSLTDEEKQLLIVFTILFSIRLNFKKLTSLSSLPKSINFQLLGSTKYIVDEGILLTGSLSFPVPILQLLQEMLGIGDGNFFKKILSQLKKTNFNLKFGGDFQRDIYQIAKLALTFGQQERISPLPPQEPYQISGTLDDSKLDTEFFFSFDIDYDKLDENSTDLKSNFFTTGIKYQIPFAKKIPTEDFYRNFIVHLFHSISEKDEELYNSSSVFSLVYSFIGDKSFLAGCTTQDAQVPFAKSNDLNSIEKSSMSNEKKIKHETIDKVIAFHKYIFLSVKTLQELTGFNFPAYFLVGFVFGGGIMQNRLGNTSPFGGLGMFFSIDLQSISITFLFGFDPIRRMNIFQVIWRTRSQLPTSPINTSDIGQLTSKNPNINAEEEEFANNGDKNKTETVISENLDKKIIDEIDYYDNKYAFKNKEYQSFEEYMKEQKVEIDYNTPVTLVEEEIIETIKVENKEEDLEEDFDMLC